MSQSYRIQLIYARRDFEVNRGIIDFGRGQFMDAELSFSNICGDPTEGAV